MKAMEKMTETELREWLRKMETEQEELARLQVKFEQEREEDDFRIRRRYYNQDNQRETFLPQQGCLFNLIDVAQDIRQAVGKRRVAVDTDFQELLRKKQREWNVQEEEIYHRIQELQRLQEEE